MNLNNTLEQENYVYKGSLEISDAGIAPKAFFMIEDQALLSVGDISGQFFLLDLETREVLDFQNCEDAIHVLKYVNSLQLVLISGCKFFQLYSISDNTLDKPYKIDSSKVNCMEFISESNTVAIAGAVSKKVEFFSLKDTKKIHEFFLSMDQIDVSDMFYHGKSKSLFMITSNFKILCYSIENKSLLHEFNSSHQSNIVSFFKPEEYSSSFISAEKSGMFNVWNIQDNGKVEILQTVDTGNTISATLFDEKKDLIMYLSSEDQTLHVRAFKANQFFDSIKIKGTYVQYSSRLGLILSINLTKGNAYFFKLER